MLPEPYRVVFVESSAIHVGLHQLLEFEGINVTALAADDLPRLSTVRADLLVVNHGRLRNSTLAISASASRGRHAPLTLALVARGDAADGVDLVERGLDAYIETPCGPREFVARVRALLRRARPVGGASPQTPESQAVRVADLHVDPSRRRVRLHGHDLRLTEHEFQLLYVLAANSGRVFDRQTLLDAIWGAHTFVTLRSVDALVKRLRQQLRSAGRGDACVETVRGVGYRLVEAAPRVTNKGVVSAA